MLAANHSVNWLNSLVNSIGSGEAMRVKTSAVVPVKLHHYKPICTGTINIIMQTFAFVHNLIIVFRVFFL